MPAHAVVSDKGARRWAQGHPWIFRSDLEMPPDAPPGVVPVLNRRGKPLGWGLWSPRSEISLRLLDPDPGNRIDAAWWRERIAAAIQRRSGLGEHTNAYRLIHGEADGLPSLICDRYDRWLVVQLMSAGLETFREDIVHALQLLVGPEGILARNDVALRRKEGLPASVEVLAGTVPEEIEVTEHGVRFAAAPWTGQKTGAFLDQRDNREFVGHLSFGRTLDCFTYHGSFALHCARRASHVTALDTSRAALARAADNVARNGFTNVELVEADAFDFLRARQVARQRFDMIVLDPPAFAKTRGVVRDAVRGYKEINLRAMRLLDRGGLLFTASCSFHLGRAAFLEMLQSAAADSGRRIVLRALRGQPVDHPEVMTIPETGYLKAALLEATD